MVNVNKIIPWLSIRSKLIIAFAGLSIIPVLLLGIHGIFSNVSMMKEIAYENLTHDVRTIRENTANFLINVETDLLLLKNIPSLRRYVHAVSRSTALVDARDSNQLSDELLAWLQTKRIYYQIRVIAQTGDELIRVECADPSSSNPQYQNVSASQLRSGRESYYFLLADNLKSNEIAFTAAELIGQRRERIPIVSFVTPLTVNASKGDVRIKRAGLLIANVFAKDLFLVMETPRHFGANGKTVLVSGDGYYLYHSERKKEWNKLLASRENDNLQHDYPASVTDFMLSGKSGIVSEGIDEIIAYAPLFPESGLSSNQSLPSFALPFYVFESVPKEVVLGPAYSFAWMFAGFLVLFLAVAIALGLLATQQFTKPIAALQEGAEIIAHGNYRHRLKVETHDEIEKLGEQFNLMAASLEAHEREIQQHRTRLEELVLLRTRELTEEKTKLQAILNNVPSAFVLLDKDYRIQTASATFTKVTGLQLDDVRGENCAFVFCNRGFCQQCVARIAVSSGNIASHIDHRIEKDGLDRYIEHTAIPLKEEGTLQAILEIITDVTERKRLEQHLLQTERLMATGEMSALIAHEFRNSLTSIKMIVQLQSESKKLNRSDIKSLHVALNSISHMEQIVDELLNFARPSPLQFQKANLNKVINESLDFVRPHFDKQRISLRHVLDPTLPAVQIDTQRMKETLVNILFNAAQAIESKPVQRRNELVAITTRNAILQETLRDFTFSRLFTDNQDNDGQNGTEVILQKGTACTLVEVSDTGPGIPEHLINRIFDPFFTTKANGTGLGLPMVKQTVNAHGGIVTVRSSAREGTVFTIYLPATNGATA
jgi:PAS domain S-box-containing protein